MTERYRVINHDEYDYEWDYIADSHNRFEKVHLDDCCDLMNQTHKLKEENKKLKQFQNKVYSTLDEEIKYKQGILELAEEQELEGSITKASFELSTLKIMRTKFKKIEDEE